MFKTAPMTMTHNHQSELLTTSTKLLNAGLIVGSMTFLSRILGLLRDMTLAHFIGASSGADAFFIAFKIPNFLRRLFAEGAFSQAFIPVLAEYREKGSSESIRNLIDRVCGCLASSLFLLTLIVILTAPVVTFLFAPGFLDQPEKFSLTQEMLRITFPYLLFISLTGFSGAILNSYGRFAVPAFTPVLLNLSLMSAAVYLTPYFEIPVIAIAWGVLLAGIMQLGFQIPFLWKIHLLPIPKIDFKDPGVKKILSLMAPAIFGISISQINLLLDTVLASFLPTGSVSWLYYSDRLVELPLGVFAITIGTVILPSLSHQYINRHQEKINHTIDWALRSILLIALPSTIALIVLSQPILTVLFQYGSTTVNDTEMSCLSLRAYAFGLLAFMLIKVLTPCYFSRQNSKTPVKIGIVAMCVNILFNLTLAIPFHYLWKIGHVGLALATSLSAFIHAALLYRSLRKQGAYQPLNGWGAYLLRLLFANGFMAAVLIGSSYVIDDWSMLSIWQRILNMTLICVVGLFAYLLALFLVGLRVKHFKTELEKCSVY